MQRRGLEVSPQKIVWSSGLKTDEISWLMLPVVVTQSHYSLTSAVNALGQAPPLQKKEAGYWLENLRASQGTPGCCWASERKLSTILTALVTKQIANCLYLSSAPATRSQTSTYCIKCLHTQLLNPTQHTKYYPLPSDLETSKSKLHFPGQVLAKNVHVLSQMVKTCMKIPCTHEAPFSSLLSRNGSCLPRQDILGLEGDGMAQAAAYCTGRSTPSCAHETANACVREPSTLPRRMSLPGLIVMTFQRLSSRRRL